MLDIKFNVSNFNEITKTLEDARLRIEDIKSISPLIHEKISQDVLNRFETAPLTQLGGLASGNIYWKKLKNSTLKQNPERLNKPILTDTGRLKESFKLNTPENIADTFYKQIVFGSKVIYANKQNSMRKFLFLHPELLKQISTLIKIYVKEGLDKTKDLNYNNLDLTSNN